MGTGALQWLVGVAVMPVLRPTCCYTCVLCNVWVAGHVTVGEGRLANGPCPQVTSFDGSPCFPCAGRHVIAPAGTTAAAMPAIRPPAGSVNCNTGQQGTATAGIACGPGLRDAAVGFRGLLCRLAFKIDPTFYCTCVSDEGRNSEIAGLRTVQGLGRGGRREAQHQQRIATYSRAHGKKPKACCAPGVRTRAHLVSLSGLIADTLDIRRPVQHARSVSKRG